MQGDLSRETFDPRSHYTAVRLQQGRVLTDADFNEQGDITRHRHERLARDVIGASGGPAEGAGFALTGGMRALAVHALDANNVWIAGEDGVLLVSSNGGGAWTVADTGSTRHLRAIARAAATGWAVGDGGTIARTTDAGATWAAQGSGTLQTLRGVAAFDAQRAWAVGDGGLALATTDGGATWTQHATGVARLYAVAFTSAQNGLAVGQGGAIVRSSDGGQSWARVDGGTTATLRAVMLNGAQALAAGDGGTLLVSNDGGATWSAATSGSTARLRALRMRNATTGWAAGDGGTLLATNNGGTTWTAQPVAGGPMLTGLSVAGSADAWLVGAGQVWRVAAGGAGAPATLPAASLLIGPGCYYVQGQHCVWEQGASLANQPDGGVAQRLAPGTYLIYLRAWQRHIGALEDPAMREVALGGPDTATRARQVAQVRALALPAPPNNTPWTCGAAIAGWDALAAPPGARLAARATPQLAATGVCDIAASAGYRRLENQLYRVEIHSVDANTGAATFKWSRENGSVAYAVQSIAVDTVAQLTTVRVAARGRDANLDLAPHDRVELVDDAAALQQRAGQLFEYLNDGDDALELVLAGVPTGSLGQDTGLHPLLRRWDQRPTAAGQNALAVVEGSWIPLEDGVEVRFAPGGSYRVGDYWQIPARTATADVEWPLDDDGAPLVRPPAGVQDGWARLGLVTVNAAGLIGAVTDCREWFPQLTRLTQLLYVGGDGQEAIPGAAVAEPLRVRVVRGALPVEGARVRFTVEAGGGTVGSPAAGVTDATTDAAGQAACPWTLGAAGPQRVRAHLLGSDGDPVAGQTLVFAAMAQANVQAGGGCAVTIGKGGNFEQLSTELLQKLLKERGGQLCICFLPGQHALDGLSIKQSDAPMRLSLHGCGPTAVVDVAGPIALGGFAALELRDLQLAMAPKAMLQLTNNAQLGLHGLRIDGKQEAPQPWVVVDGTAELRMHQCEVAAAAPASVVVQNAQGLCEIMHSQIAGDLAFYGMPGTDAAGAAPPAAALVNALNNGDFQVPAGRGQLVVAHNQLARLNLGQDMVKQLIARKFDGLFHTVVLQGNSLGAAPSLCAGVFMSVTGNHFTATKPTGNLYGAMVGRRAAASGNVGELVGDTATLYFLVTKGQFRGAANMVFTLPQSTA
ncbi:DUF6519 domain-containing protein [Alicycliphilus denitrificans]|uniref:DUF6519 domain-containing protein n=1 Tax=Alicycliphilus denitrificans TaxID=179636 RepID=UPI0001D9E2A0|nr:DUF6519 domain-containing protein [Alicycliphilus denitrificans]ADU98782.1 hypothetical protein Alide_1017 [Alicycliphilus denitrificans BC]